MKSSNAFLICGAVILATLSFSCKKSTTDITSTSTTDTTSITSVVMANYKSAVTISTSGTSIVLKSNGEPDHLSPYWPTNNSLWEAQISGHTVNPGNLVAQNFVMTLPAIPAAASSKTATALGPIGMSLNGVAIFNDQEGGNQALDAGVLLSFDRAGAHSGPGGLYHYHVTGDFTSKDDAKLIGFLRDGFPIYGRKDTTGTYPTLDAYGGHFGPTHNFPNGIYHYHASNVNYLNSGVYILKSGSYYGTAGTFTF